MPVSSTGCVMPLIVSSPSTVTSSPERRMSVGGEGDLGRALGVEEVGGEQVRREVLVLHLDAR